MASGKLLRQLISSGARGDLAAFRAASEAVIQEERQKKHHLLANDLERLLYADQAAFSEGKVGGHRTFSKLPKGADSGIGLMEERPAVREEKDIVLSDDARSIFEEILLEQNRADVLRSYGVQPAQKLLFCGPSGCGKTLAAEVLANSLSLPLVLVRIDSVVSSFLGETASNLRKVFDFITQHPVVALFDEFDALAKDRGDESDHGELKRSVNAVRRCWIVTAARASWSPPPTTKHCSIPPYGVDSTKSSASRCPTWSRSSACWRSSCPASGATSMWSAARPPVCSKGCPMRTSNGCCAAR